MEVHADGQYIIFWLDDLDIRTNDLNQKNLDVEKPTSNCIDSLVISDVQNPDQPLINICGTLQQFHPTKRVFTTLIANTARILLRQGHSTQKTRGRGFKLLYVSGFFECFDVEYILKGEGLLASHMFPQQACESVTYTIQFQTRTEMFFTFLRYASDQNCLEAYLDVDQTSVLCGSVVSHIALHRRYFKTFTISAQNIQFLAKFETKPSRDVYLEKVLGTFLSEQYNSTNYNSTWILTTGKQSSAFIILDITKPFEASPDECKYQGLYVYDGSKVLHFTCPSINARQSYGQILISSSNSISIRLVNGTGISKAQFSVKYGYYIAQSSADSTATPENTIVHTIDSPSTTTQNSAIFSPSMKESNIPSTVPPKADPVSKPEIRHVYPVKGIVAGGSILTISGRNFASGLQLYLGNHRALPHGQCTQKQCLFWTPAVDNRVIGKPLEIKAIFPSYDMMTLSFNFTYKPNPLLTEVYPLTILAAGGTTITVKGSGFQSVTNSRMTITMTHTVNLDRQSKTNFTSPCNQISDEILKCQTPTITVPNQFLIAEASKPNQFSRRKRSTFTGHGADFFLEIENEVLDFHLGFQLDGDLKYYNLSESLPDYSDLKIYVGVPTFKPFDELMVVRAGEHLQIQGYNLTNGLGWEDYAILLDQTKCQVSDLTLNSLFCLIPKRHGELLNAKKHFVHVFPGSILGGHYIGEVKYKVTEDISKYIIAGCVVVASVTVVALLVEALCVYCGKNKT